MTDQHKEIRVSRQELQYLRDSDFLPNPLLNAVESVKEESDGAATLSVSRVLAEGFRAAFTDRLARVGFRTDYEPTSEGELLERLIDRFYCP